MERLQKVISNSGYTSRRKAEELIQNGKVKVNGEIVKELGVKVSGTDLIEVNGTMLSNNEKVYFLLNKPRGVISSVSDDKGRKTVVDLINTNKRIYPIGRLDYDTTGVLLLTNDGDFSNLLTHPKNEIEKVYVAKLEGIIKGVEIEQLKKGVTIDGNVKVKATRVKLRKVDNDSKKSFVELTIHEGKNHQVKKMFEAVGFSVEKLKRERVAFLTVDNLKSGEYRELNKKEVHQLYALANKEK